MANFLNSMGARVRGAGTNVLRIEGVTELEPACHMVIPDRIEAGTLMVAAAMTRGSLVIDNIVNEHLKPITAKLREAGVSVEERDDGSIYVEMRHAHRHRREDHAVPGVPHRPAGAVHGIDVDQLGFISDNRDRVRKSLHARV